MDADGYRVREKKIALPQDGTTPTVPETVGKEEQQVLLAWISCLWRAVEVVGRTSQHRMIAESAPTGAETFLGWKRWLLSHHFFIPLLAMIGHALSSAANAMRDGRRQQVREWVDLASRMRRGCGALFMYSIDFQPCSTIYCRHIRSQMPAAFSGYEIRERQSSFQPAVELFHDTFPKCATETLAQEMRSLWIAADVRYHELHERCMVQAVPGRAAEVVGEKTSAGRPESLRAAHRREHGEVPPIGEDAYQEYDRWFAIERRPDVTRLDYVYQVCDIIERLLADLMVGHRLEATVRDELLDSMKAALVVFGRWAGPVQETSPFYPKYLRGE